MSSTAAFCLLSTLGGYLVTSFLLLKYPALLHQRKKQRFLSRHISHRGGAGENLENTMAAFQHAVTIGTDMLELDCHITKDEQVVVSHDANLKRSTGVNVNVSDLKYCELPPYLCKLDVPFQRGSGVQTQVISRGGNCLYPQSHLASPQIQSCSAAHTDLGFTM